MEYLCSPFIDSWNASLSMVLELTIHQLTKITKSLNIYYVFIILRQRSITKVSQFLAPYSPLVFFLLLFSFSFVGLGEDPSKVEARKNDHQGNLGNDRTKGMTRTLVSRKEVKIILSRQNFSFCKFLGIH